MARWEDEMGSSNDIDVLRAEFRERLRKAPTRESGDRERAVDRSAITTERKRIAGELRVMAREWERRASRRDDPMAVQLTEELNDFAAKLEAGDE